LKTKFKRDFLFWYNKATFQGFLSSQRRFFSFHGCCKLAKKSKGLKTIFLSATFLRIKFQLKTAYECLADVSTTQKNHVVVFIRLCGFRTSTAVSKNDLETFQKRAQKTLRDLMCANLWTSNKFPL
jgi:hypothetical protein